MKTCNTTTAGVANSAPASDPITYCQTKTSVWIRVGGEAFTTLKRIADVLNKWDGETHTPADILRLYGVGPILDGITFSAPKFPVLSNVTGKPHASDPGAIKAMMLEQVTGTTNWAADVEAAKALGVTTFVEFGPGKVLSGLIKKIDAALVTANVSDLATLDAAMGVL